VRKREAQYLSKVADIGCILCYRAGYSGTPAEIHHIRGLGLGMGVRNSHYNALPLCPEHHRGNTGYHGLGRKAFERKYGVTEQELQLQVKELLNEEDENSQEGSESYA
jgi:hypothetical protein